MSREIQIWDLHRRMQTHFEVVANPRRSPMTSSATPDAASRSPLGSNNTPRFMGPTAEDILHFRAEKWQAHQGRLARTLTMKNVEIRETLHEIYSADVIGRPSKNADGSMRFHMDPEHDRVLRFKKAVAMHNRRLIARRAAQKNKEMNDRMASMETSYSQRIFLSDYFKKKSVMSSLKKPHLLTALNNFLAPAAAYPRLKVRSNESIHSYSNRPVRGYNDEVYSPPFSTDAFAVSEGRTIAAPGPGASDSRILCEIKHSKYPQYPNKQLEVEIFRLFEPQISLDVTQAGTLTPNGTRIPSVKGQVGLIMEQFCVTSDTIVNTEFLSMNTLKSIAEQRCLDLSRKLRRVKCVGVKVLPASIDFLDPSAFAEGQPLDVFEPLQLTLDPAGEELLSSVLLDYYLSFKLQPT